MTSASRPPSVKVANVGVPEFVPHPWARSGHLQTVAGRYLISPRRPLISSRIEIEVDGDDRLLAFDSVPENWRQGDPLALMVHGLGGSADSPYIVRIAARLWRKGVRVVRMNLRGAGLGFGLARGIYHAGRTEDLRAVARVVTAQSPGSPLALIGFSLGANLVLKLAAEAARQPLESFDCVLAANPPIDLLACCQAIQKPENWLYDRNFVHLLRSDIARLHARFPDLGPVRLPASLNLYQFDDLYTAPRNGFNGAADYYRKSSSANRIPEIESPGLVVHSVDDPFIPVEPFIKVSFPPRLALELIPGGGHLGYISHQRWLGDRRWLDSRFITWLSHRWSLNSASLRRVS